MTTHPEARGYSEAMAEQVRQEHAAGMSRRDLADKYRMAMHTVSDIINRKRAYAVVKER